jgi:hypothetical protein
MLTAGNGKVELAVEEDGSRLLLADKARGLVWRADLAGPGYRTAGGDGAFRPLGPGSVEEKGSTLVASYPAGSGSIRFVFALGDDHVEVRLECDADEVEAVALPGPFFPREGSCEVAVPLYQGALFGQNGPEWEMTVRHGGHLSFSMAMGAVLGERGGLLVCHESPANWTVKVGRTADGPMFQFVHGRCPVDGWAGATLRLYPTDAGVTAACRRYRARVTERGDLVTWEEKIARKPILKSLFGGMMAFIGYNASPEIDYAGGARALRQLGFESVFYYPVRMFQYSLDFQMGGDAPIWLSDEEIGAIRAVDGAHVSPWAWVVEGLDDGSDAMRSIFKKGPDGQPIPNWQIDQQRWYLVCTPYQIEHVKERLAGDMAAMDWIHFDVSAVWAGKRCFDTGHALHDGRPMGCLGDMEWTRRLFSPETVGNRAVSSEGFNDHHAAFYDIGSTKMMPPMPWDPDCVPVPMTMLVFHDSCIHDWWELHNYNAHSGFGLSALPHGVGTQGCGQPALKAAMDALYGCPPNLFPFGKQYGWVDIATRESYSYTVRVDDEEVQTALRAALPVARLHKTTGMQDMTSFELLSEDRAVQATTFADGTRIVANLSEHEAEAPDLEPLPPHSWHIPE